MSRLIIPVVLGAAIAAQGCAGTVGYTTEGYYDTYPYYYGGYYRGYPYYDAYAYPYYYRGYPYYRTYPYYYRGTPYYRRAPYYRYHDHGDHGTPSYTVPRYRGAPGRAPYALPPHVPHAPSHVPHAPSHVPHSVPSHSVPRGPR